MIDYVSKRKFITYTLKLFEFLFFFQLFNDYLNFQVFSNFSFFSLNCQTLGFSNIPGFFATLVKVKTKT